MSAIINGWANISTRNSAGYVFVRDAVAVGSVVGQWGGWVCIHPEHGEVDIFEDVETAMALVEKWPIGAAPDGFLKMPQIDLWRRWLFRRDGGSVCYLECSDAMLTAAENTATRMWCWRVTRLVDRRVLIDGLTREEAVDVCRAVVL